MSDSSSQDQADREERGQGGAPSGAGGPDPDAWATATEEDLRAERARRRERYGPQPGDAAEELRRLADTIAERLAGLGLGLATGPFAAQARAALEPVIERNAETLRHLANAGQELLAAYRSAVLSHEERWTRGEPGGAERTTGPSAAAAREAGAGEPGPDAGRPGPGGGAAAGPETEPKEPGGEAAGAEPGERREQGDSGGPGGSQRIDLD
ncbi:DUF5304 family protein [Streptomyces hoynatensis]|uniref:DUF5304 domain-containing protein n=1 Tax=Streptomyces hoynatensis TaxID=1141874 RepID=A0A3A9Z1I6_9ACTN|nr:DUF5304 family protein [Streptomyces hoynatensis]RKN42271.1 hypothetical protein D7294_12525 [Streptomyces hoynatensis]